MRVTAALCHPSYSQLRKLQQARYNTTSAWQLPTHPVQLQESSPPASGLGTRISLPGGHTKSLRKQPVIACKGINL